MAAVAVVAAGCALLPTRASAQGQDAGWWVIVGAFPTEPPERMKRDYDAVNDRAARCSLRPFNDFSGKFSGFRPGLNVFVLGAYPSQVKAQAAKALARPCFSNAYLKRGRYAGE